MRVYFLDSKLTGTSNAQKQSGEGKYYLYLIQIPYFRMTNGPTPLEEKESIPALQVRRIII